MKILLGLLLVIPMIISGCGSRNTSYTGISQSLADSLIQVCDSMKVTNPRFYKLPQIASDLYGKNLCEIKKLYGDPIYCRVDTFAYGEPVNFYNEFENQSDLDIYYKNIEYETTLAKIPYIEIKYYEWVNEDRAKLILYCVDVQDEPYETPIYGAVIYFTDDWRPFDYLEEKYMTLKELVKQRGEPIRTRVDTYIYGKLKGFGVAFSETDGIRPLYNTYQMDVRYYEWPVDSSRTLRLYFEEKQKIDSAAKPIWGMQAENDYYLME